MRFPKLKNAALCRALVYLIIFLCFLSPFALSFLLPIPDAARVMILLFFLVLFVIYLFKRFAFLMTLDVTLATQHCHNTAREHFVLPSSFRADKTERRLVSYGRGAVPISVSPAPTALRYRVSRSLLGDTPSVERFVLIYHVDLLEESVLRDCLRSATLNTEALVRKHAAQGRGSKRGKKEVHRVTVTVIYAKAVSEEMRASLSDAVCKKGGDGFELAHIPCVIDLEAGRATFDSLRIPFVVQYPVKNRGIRILRKRLFGGRLPLATSPLLPEPFGNTGDTLWSLIRTVKHELCNSEKELKRQFEGMHHEQVVLDEDGYLCVKWEERGVWLLCELDEEKMTATVDPVHLWAYPKSNEIAKGDRHAIEALIRSHLASLGYSVRITQIKD